MLGRVALGVVKIVGPQRTHMLGTAKVHVLVVLVVVLLVTCSAENHRLRAHGSRYAGDVTDESQCAPGLIYADNRGPVCPLRCECAMARVVWTTCRSRC
uniref:Uncharacterized protein n=1 Tax=Timema cristinae TaxID=61476 RepID=A0A7R9GSP5_TIMCR|nr:unnamed protein product [Timema cristinae]